MSASALLSCAAVEDRLENYLELTLLKPGTTANEIKALCVRAQAAEVLGVCVPPCFTYLARGWLHETQVKVITVVGFPLGFQSLAAKRAEVQDALAQGAHELDVVWNLAHFRSALFSDIELEADELQQMARDHNAKLKIILETGLLTPDEVKQAAHLFAQHPVDFIKTSTGTLSPGAELSKVALLRRHLPKGIQIKAAGGIRNAALAWTFLDAGASRLGSSTLLSGPRD